MLPRVRRLAAIMVGIIAACATRHASAGPLKTWGAEPPDPVVVK